MLIICSNWDIWIYRRVQRFEATCENLLCCIHFLIQYRIFYCIFVSPLQFKLGVFKTSFSCGHALMVVGGLNSTRLCKN